MALPKHRQKPAATYLVTTNTWQRRALLRSSAAEIVQKKLFEYRDRGFFLVHEYVVMPNHLHVILTPGATTSLEKAVQLIKGGSSRDVKSRLRNKFPLWQPGFTEHQIAGNEDFNRHLEYIHQNPVKARLAARPEDYAYSSAAGKIAVDPWKEPSAAKAAQIAGRVPAGLKPRPSRREGSAAEAAQDKSVRVTAGLKPRPSARATSADQAAQIENRIEAKGSKRRRSAYPRRPGGKGAALPAQVDAEGQTRGLSPTPPRLSGFRVFATCNIGDEALDLLRQRGYELEVYDKVEPPPRDLIIEKVRSGIDGLITTLRDKIDAEVFEAGRGTLKVVAQDAVGFDNINRADANRYKIPFTHTADVLTEATAEFALLILGNVARKLCPSERLVRDHRWGTWHPFLPFLGDEVTGKTISVIGTGRIGQAFMKKAVGFDVDFLCYDPAYQAHDFVKKIQDTMDVRFRNGFTSEPRTIRYVSFEEALAGGDFVSLHVPLIREGEGGTPTYHLMNERTLRLMKPTAFLVNTSRGPVVDEQALVAAIRENVIAGAALDVFEVEPLHADSPLRDPKIENRVRLFSHFASAGRVTRLSTDPNKGMAGRCVQGLIDVLEGNYGGNPADMPYVVNKEAFR